jgi:hypothetical protein
VITAKARNALSRIGLGIALWLGGLGLFVSFDPGAEAGWFGTAAGFAAAVLLSPNGRLRLVGVALLVAFAWFAWLGYQRGQQYQEWLREEMPRLREQLQQRQGQKPPTEPTVVP